MCVFVCVCMCVCVCLRVCVCVCVSRTSQVIPRKLLKSSFVTLGTVTASVTRMHHMLIVLTLTFTHGALNHENNTCLIISETIQAMPIKFPMKILR